MSKGIESRTTRIGAVCIALVLVASATRADVALRRGTRMTPAAGTSSRALKLVQFGSAPTDDDVRALEAAGARVVQYVPRNTFLVWAPDRAPEALGDAIATRSRAVVVSAADFQPRDAVAPKLDRTVTRNEQTAVTVQFYAGAGTLKRDLRAARRAGRVLRPPRRVLGGRYVNLRLLVPGTSIEAIANLASVVNVEPYVAPRLYDERQGQILAANLDGLGQTPSAPGYLAWLAGHGFSTSPGAYPVTVVVDDGIDNGTVEPTNSEFREGNDPLGASRLAFAVLPPGSSATSAEGPDGHGNINASILAGFNDGTGPDVGDSDGYHYGLGIAPYARIANVRIFAPFFDSGFSDTQMVDDYYARGARVSSNSWGADAGGAYDAGAQEYDALARDARPLVAGNQEMMFVFSAGNAGPFDSTMGTPGTAKNVLTVGASETSDPAASAGDGCGFGLVEGDDARDMAWFSSRGPCLDGRVKPDIVAPGTFIHGAASQPSFYGSGVCGAADNDFAAPGTDALFPAGSAYTWSAGTSHSAPAIAGYVSLIQEFLARVYGRVDPSPALQKAYVVHSAAHLDGQGANEDLPGNNQGFGRADMALGFDTAAPRLIVDQEVVFTESGQSAAFAGEVFNPGAPVRVTLVWTDAPGAPFADAYVNDLDLVVEVNGDTYRGNVFVGGVSQPGGAADPRNNVESVFLPAGLSGPITIRVTATVIGGDGVPNNADASDQDFALVAYNVSSSESRLSTDRAAYRCTDHLGVRLVDGGMAGAGSLTLSVTSDAGDAETVVAMETAAGSALFTVDLSTLPGAAAPGSGALEVADGQQVTVRYDDPDDGSGHPAIVDATVTIDCVAPAVSQVAGSASLTSMTVSALTDEPTRLVVRWGTSCASLNQTAIGPAATSHVVTIGGLTPLTDYFFALHANDAAGNETTDDNGGACYMVHTDVVRTFTVNSTADAPDATPGDELCAAATGQCTLRAAVQEANAAPGADKISVPGGLYTLRLGGPSEDAAMEGDLDVTDDVVIAGAGASVTHIDGGGRDRVFEFLGATTSFISDLTVQGGRALDIEYGGGIENHLDSTLTVERVAVVRNYGDSAGIDNDGILTLTDSLLRLNAGEFSAGGLGNYGLATLDRVVVEKNRSYDAAGIGNYGAAIVDRTVIRRNRGISEGGGFNNSGYLELRRSTIERNQVGNRQEQGYGGGLINDGYGDVQAVTVTRNRAFGDGGGIANWDTLILANSTVSGNRANDGFGSGDGGGVENVYVAYLTNVTVTRNRAVRGNQLHRHPIAYVFDVVNTLVTGPGDDCVGLPTSLGHNLADDGSCGFTGPGDLSGVSARVGSPKYNGGLTKTCALDDHSPAIDAGDTAACPATDQRGVSRPQGSGCDIGAYEAEP